MKLLKTFLALFVVSAASVLALGGPGGPTITYPSSVCVMISASTLFTNCGEPSQLCPGTCTRDDYDKARCDFNPLSSCSVATSQTILTQRYRANCSIAAGGSCACDSGFTYVGVGSITKDRCAP